ncbi:SET domain-containing protein [Chloropicon roscoffensis]|uniref:SET domain-containing protein n=2 Tax=Chloropicon roscoffensis TaxID=1461544 RepID=A0AAX4P1X7_9CHLO
MGGQRSSSATACEPPAGFAGLLAWATRRGLILRSCVPSEEVEEGGRGIVATERVPPNTALCEIPERLILTARRSSVKRLGLSSLDVLAVELLIQRKRGDTNPYLSSLPTTYTNLHHWSARAAAELQCQDFIKHHGRLRDQALQDWKAVTETGGRAWCNCNFEDYLWARSTILSRSVYIPGPGNEAGGLVPVGDMFNYAPPAGPDPPLPPCFLDYYLRDEAEAKVDGQEAKRRKRGSESTYFAGVSGSGAYDEKSGCFIFRSGQRGYEAGEQIFVTYGMYTNRSLLEIYGFLLEDNPQDSVNLASVIDGDVLDGAAVAKLGSCFEVYQDGFPSWDLLCLVRWKAACLSHRGGKREARRIQTGCPCTLDLEAEAIEYLQEICSERLRRYGTSASQDEVTLSGLGGKEGEEGGLMELAVRWRLCQKRILVRAVGMCEAYLKYLNGPGALSPSFTV